MMMNLFSIFDPSTSMNFSMNWMSMMLIYFLFPLLFWFLPSRFNMMFLLILLKLMNEMKILLFNKMNYLNCFMLISLFFIIFMNNLLSLFPYIFFNSSHMCMSFSFALTIWMSIILYTLMKKKNSMFIHLTPQGTPNLLMPFMVLIETISNYIRPLTLSIRLTANIIAGHLLMTLISNSINKMFYLMLIIILIQSILMILELAISFIQAYVFSILMTLYSSEI